jgi:hypothetical protein
MKICPLEADVFHVNGLQNEAKICDQNYTQEKASVPKVKKARWAPSPV